MFSFRILSALAASASAAGAGLLAVSLSFPSSQTPASAALVQVQEARADGALRQPSPAFEQSASESRKALALAPATGAALLRLAYIERATQGRFTANAKDAINRSFDIAPYGPDVTPWRVRFLFENWPSLPPELRRRAMEELTTVARYRGIRMLKVTEQIQDPSGAFAATLITASARSYDVEERASGGVN